MCLSVFVFEFDYTNTHAHTPSTCQSESQVNQFLLLLLVKVICNQLYSCWRALPSAIQFNLGWILLLLFLVITLNDVQRAHHQCQAIKINLKLRNNNNNNNSNNLDIESHSARELEIAHLWLSTLFVIDLSSSVIATYAPNSWPNKQNKKLIITITKKKVNK